MAEDVQAALLALERMSTKRDRDNLVRFGITATRPFGVSMANLKILAKRLGRDHALAAGLWDTGRYEARMLATLVDDPALVTPAQMERWCRDFDNWGICDTACFVLFDRTPHAWAKVSEWSSRREEFVKRGAFALLACLALARQTRWRRAVPRGAAPHRAGRDRRPQLREEGCQLGDPPRGQAQRGAERRVGRGRPAPGGFGECGGALGGEGRPQGAHERRRAGQAGGPTPASQPPEGRRAARSRAAPAKVEEIASARRRQQVMTEPRREK